MNKYTMRDICVGIVESFTVEITKEMQDAFTKITGDINPMHIDYQYAIDNGFQQEIVYGMLTASFYSTLVGVYLPGKYCLFHECDVSFNKPVYVGDVLTVVGEVVEIHEVFNRITIKAFIKNQEGKKVSKAMLIVGIMGENDNGE